MYSFYATKTIATGEGGMIVTGDPALARRMKLMRLHGIDRGVHDRQPSTRPSWYYEVVAPGFKYNMTDISAALGIHQLAKAGAIAKAARKRLRGVIAKPLPGSPSWRPVWLGLRIRTPGTSTSSSSRSSTSAFPAIASSS